MNAKHIQLNLERKRRLELDNLDEYCNGTQLVKVWQGYETGMRGGWHYSGTPL